MATDGGFWVAARDCSQFNDRRLCEQVFDGYGKIIVKQVHQAVQPHNPCTPDVFSITGIADLLKCFLKALDKICNIELLPLAVAGIGIKPPEIGIAIVNRLLEDFVKRCGHGYRSGKGGLQRRFIGFQLHVLWRDERIEYERGNEVLPGSENLQFGDALHQCSVLIFCWFDYQKRNFMVFPQSVQQTHRKRRFARARRADYQHVLGQVF